MKTPIQELLERVKLKDVNFTIWGNDEFYFIPTISLHKEFKIVSLCFMFCVLEFCY